MGSPRYMSPEQLEHTAGVDARADVWSLGAVLYELCAGNPAFDAPNMAALATAILTKEPAPLSDVPAELAAVVARCLKKDREARMPSVAALARALVPFARAEQITLVDRVERIAATTRSSVMPAPPARTEPLAASVDGITGPPHAKKHTVSWLLAAVGAVAVALALWSTREPRRELSSGAMLRGALAVRAVRLPTRPSPVVAPPKSAAAAPSSASAPTPVTNRPPVRPVAAPGPSASSAPASGINAHGLLDRK
jgi:serine/threonine-protein kinase